MKRVLCIFLVLTITILMAAPAYAKLAPQTPQQLLMSGVDQGDLVRVKKALEDGAKVNSSLVGGMTPLARAVDRQHFAIAKYLIEQGARAEDQALYGDTILILATQRNNVSFVSLLLENGADVNNWNTRDGFTALMHAAMKNNVAVLKLLLKYGADINRTNKAGHTAIHIARGLGNTQAVQFLEEAGAK